MRSAWAIAPLSFFLGLPALSGSPAQAPGLALERAISLGKVTGRIDHLAIDLGRKRLFVSELGNTRLPSSISSQAE
jgi:hypothetical protein